MSPEIIEVPELADSSRYGYAQCVRHGGVVYVAGQTGVDTSFSVAGPDIEAQARAAFANVGHALVAAGSDWAHVLRLEVLMTNLARDFAAYSRVRTEVLGGALVASHVMEVSALATPELLIEVVATAAVA